MTVNFQTKDVEGRNHVIFGELILYQEKFIGAPKTTSLLTRLIRCRIPVWQTGPFDLISTPTNLIHANPPSRLNHRSSICSAKQNVYYADVHKEGPSGHSGVDSFTVRSTMIPANTSWIVFALCSGASERDNDAVFGSTLGRGESSGQSILILYREFQ